jgi:hypothetical protein
LDPVVMSDDEPADLGQHETDASTDADEQGVDIDYRAVARVASRSQLLSVDLRSCRADCASPATEFPVGWSDDAFVGYRARVASTPDGDGKFRNEMSFLAVYKAGIDFAVASLDEMGDDTPPDMALEVVFELAYRLAENAELEDGDLEQFALANSTLHAWPYWREIGQAMTTRMGIPPLVIGTYKLPSADDPEA